MMRKLTSLMFVLLFLTSCVNEGTEEPKENPDQESETLQADIENLMSENDLKYESIIDFDIIDDFIFSVSLNTNGGLDLSMIKYESGKLEWIDGGDGATILGADENTPPFAYIIQPEESNVKQVNVFDEPAKAVTYYDEKTEDFTREVKYWIAYTEKEPYPGEVEYITE